MSRNPKKVALVAGWDGIEKIPGVRYITLLIIIVPLSIVFGIGFVLGWFACKYWGLG